jgi:hypothetical protein
MSKKILIILLIVLGLLFSFLYMKKFTYSPEDKNESFAIAHSVDEAEKSIQKNTDATLILQDDLVAISDDLSKLHSNLVGIQGQIEMQLNQADMEDISTLDDAENKSTIPVISYGKSNTALSSNREKTIDTILHTVSCSNRLFLASQKIITEGLQVFGTFFHEESL